MEPRKGGLEKKTARIAVPKRLRFEIEFGKHGEGVDKLRAFDRGGNGWRVATSSIRCLEARENEVRRD